MRREDLTLLTAGLMLVLTAALLIILQPRLSSVDPSPRPAANPSTPTEATAMPTQLLTDPFLQNPTPTAVQVATRCAGGYPASRLRPTC